MIFYLLVNTGVVPGEEQSILDKIENGNSFTSLLWGTFGATVCTTIFYLMQWFNKDGNYALPNIRYFCKFIWEKEHHSTPVPTKEPEENDDAENNDTEEEDVDPSLNAARPLLSLPEIVESFLHGMGRIFPALIVLTLAWAVGSIMVDVGADRLFSRWIVGGLNPDLLPTLSFLISFLMALATGTSWGTMSILFPLLLVPTYIATDGNAINFYATTAGVLSGSVAGDHVSPISDTTVLSALSCDCQLLRHVVTQTPYVAVVVIISLLVGTIPIGYDAWPNLVGIFLGFFLCFIFAYFVCAPVESVTGRYDLITELRLKIYKDPELLELKEYTKNYYTSRGVNGEAEDEVILDTNDDDGPAKGVEDDDSDEKGKATSSDPDDEIVNA